MEFPIAACLPKGTGPKLVPNYQVAAVPPAENENEDKENSLWRRCLLTRHSR